MRVVQKCLAKKPEERWQSAAELTSQLQEIAEANLENSRLRKEEKNRVPKRKKLNQRQRRRFPWRSRNHGRSYHG